MIDTVNQKVVNVHLICPHCCAVVDTLDISNEHRPNVSHQMKCNSCYEDFEVTVDTKSGCAVYDIPYQHNNFKKMEEMVKARQREYAGFGFEVKYLGDWR